MSPSAPIIALKGFMRFLRLFSVVDCIQHRTCSTGKASQRRLPLDFAGLLAFLAGLAGAAFAIPPALATRIDQYSHARTRPVVWPLIAPASRASPSDREATLSPIAMLCTW